MSELEDNSNKTVIIIGAGPAGISAAYELTKAGIHVDVYEASSHIGGMARSFDLFGQRVDCGPHRFFSKEKHINDFFKELVKDDYTIINRLTRIFYRNAFFDYPLKIANVFANLKLAEIVEILLYYVYQKIFPIKYPATFEEWVTNRFGKKLFDIFFKNYSEKLWGIPCSKIDADWAAQRIKTLSLYQAVKSALIGDKDKKHKTLVDQFAYPNRGTGMLYENAAKYIQENGGNLHLDSVVSNILLNSKNDAIGIKLKTGEEVLGSHIISTMPITMMTKELTGASQEVIEACNQLYYRNTILVYLEVDSDMLFPDNWIYVHSPDIKMGRITNFRNWCPSLYGEKKTSILCLEYWAFDEDDIWKAEDEFLSQLGIDEIKRVKLIPEEANIVNTHVLKISKCYPVYETGYGDKMKIISNYLDTINYLYPIGRYGSFKYNNQDHSILMGIIAASNIIKDENTNLWEVNTDIEYQEEKKIKDVLLQ